MRLQRSSPQRNAEASDEELVLLAQRGDRDAFGLLYDRYLSRVHGYCYRVLGTRESAEDATTETFIRALAGLPGCRAGSFRPWLFAIAHNVTVDVLRRQRTISLAHVPEPVDPAEFEDAVLTAADWQRIERVLGHLSDDQRHVVALRLTGLSTAEIGESLGKTRNAIDALQHRALLRLKSLVATSEATASNDQGGGYRG
ncbi:MAG: RNA polymerase sigma factor [Thermomicrobiales bacterium]|nr:RNA polymerase sigma factor [Thermomicrobiales bacterium]